MQMNKENILQYFTMFTEMRKIEEMSLFSGWLGLFAVCLLLSAGVIAEKEDVFDAQDACGGNFTGATGNATISGSNYTHCTWQIMLTKASQTAIKFTQFMLGTGAYVVVYDGKKDKNGTNLVANITGTKDSFVAIAFSKSVTIELYHNSTDNITLSFDFDTTDCFLAYMPAYARRVTAPLYLASRGSVMCQYKVLGAPEAKDKAAALAFTQFNIAHGSMTVSDGSQTVTTQGSTDAKLPNDFISKVTQVLEFEIFLNFTLQNSSVQQSFDAFFSTIDQSCSRVINVTKNETITVNIPADKSPLTDCRMILSAQTGNTLLLNMTRIQLQSTSDRVTITDGGSLGSRAVSELSPLPREGNIVTSSGSELWVRLVIGELPGERIFTVDVYEQEDGGRYYKDGNITLEVNSSVPANYYQFIAPVGQVTVTFDQNAHLFPKASLDFYDGPQPDSNLLMAFKTGTQFFPVTSSSNTMLLIARNFDGPQNFSAQYHSVDQSCNSLSYGPDGSYSLKKGATPRTLCRWTVRPQTNNGYVILHMDSLILGVNETVTIYAGVMEYGKTIATFDQHTIGQRLPSISSRVGTGLELVYRSNNTCKNCTAPVVKGSYKVTMQDCDKLLTSPAGTLTSPNYPNLYSLNSDCVWDATNTSSNTTSNQLFYLSFSDLQLGQGDSVMVKQTVNSTTKTTLATYGGMTMPEDIVVAAEGASVEFSSGVVKHNDPVTAARGFQANYWKLDCGGNLTTTKASGNFSTPGYPGEVKKTTLCVWIIHYPVHGHNSTIRNSAQFQITLKHADKKMSNGALTIHDGGSLRDPILHFNYTKGKTGNVIARTNTIVVVYNYTSTAGQNGGGMGFSLKFSAFSCNKSRQCGGNGWCIHPDWVCNGVDNCGDMSDERNCTGPGPSAGQNGLVKSYWIAVCLILGLLFGAILAFLIPAIYRRIKYPHYDQLRDLSAPVVT